MLSFAVQEIAGAVHCKPPEASNSSKKIIEISAVAVPETSTAKSSSHLVPGTASRPPCCSTDCLTDGSQQLLGAPSPEIDTIPEPYGPSEVCTMMSG